MTHTLAGAVPLADSSATATAGTLDVQQFINRQALSAYQWRIVALCFLIVFLDGLDTAAMGFIAPALSVEWASRGPAWAGDERRAGRHGLGALGSGRWPIASVRKGRAGGRHLHLWRLQPAVGLPAATSNSR